MKTLITILTSCLIATCGGFSDHSQQNYDLARVQTQNQQLAEKYRPLTGKSFSGSYISSQFAQRHHDWEKAGAYLKDVLEKDKDNIHLLKRAMVLAMGSGHYDLSRAYAQKVAELDNSSSLALMFMAIGAFHDRNYEEAATYVQQMPEGSLSSFVMPLLRSWAQASIGRLETEDLHESTIHVYHAILIADFLGQYDHVRTLLDKAENRDNITDGEREEIADILGHIGDKEKALQLYKKLQADNPGLTHIADKIESLRQGTNEPIFTKIETPEKGIARALYEMSKLLYRDMSDDSARIFAQMAAYLDPSLTDSHLLLASITARNERYDQAIDYYHQVPPDSEFYLEARRRAAELLEDANRVDDALTELSRLADHHGDIEALITIGDIHRRQKNFDLALSSYNEAEERLNGEIPPEYWYLHYVRGMSYEQSGNWQKAEEDLKAALAFEPDHPYVLNYLGYAWADQGINLKESLDMIKRATMLRPHDGYITDSLGWIHYRMGNYEKAVPYLEKAVELLPYDPVINDHLGDAYWHVGRKLEAQFQWKRAKNHAEDEELIGVISEKLENGPQKLDIVKEASSYTHEQQIIKP